MNEKFESQKDHLSLEILRISNLAQSLVRSIAATEDEWGRAPEDSALIRTIAEDLEIFAKDFASVT